MLLLSWEKTNNDSKEYLRYIHTPNPAPRRRETRFEKSSPAKVPEPQPLEDSWRFFGLGSERAQFFGGVVAGGPSGGQEEEEGVDQSHRKADISSLAGVGALQQFFSFCSYINPLNTY